MRKKWYLISFTALFVTTSVTLTACGNATNESGTAPISVQPQTSISGTDNSITVNSSEQVSVAPDIAKVVYAVQTQAADAAECQNKNAEDIQKVLELLKTLGIQETSIQTSDYNMGPVYDYSNNTETLKGYQATSTLTVSDLPLEGLGEFLTQSVSSGINTVESVSYEASKYDEAYQEALKLAVASAYSKAAALAEAGKCSVGNVMSIIENSNYSEERYTDNAMKNSINVEKGVGMMATEDTLDIMPGEIDVQVDITVQYQIS